MSYLIRWFCLIAFLLAMIDCGGIAPPLRTPQPEINKFVQSILTRDGQLTGLKYETAYKALLSASRFLYRKDNKKFQKLASREVTVNTFIEQSMSIYDQSFLEFAKEFLEDADANANRNRKKQSFENSWAYFNSKYFRIITKNSAVKQDIKLIKENLDKAYEKIVDTLKLTKEQQKKTMRISLPSDWLNHNLSTGFENNNNYMSLNRIPVFLTHNLDELREIVQHNSTPESHVGGITTFSTISNLPDSLSPIVMRIVIPYYNAWSIPMITHEIAHAIHLPAYSNIDSLVKYQKGEKTELKKISPYFPRTTGVTIEGFPYWTLYNIGIFPQLGLLPTTKEAFHEISKKTNPYSLEILLSGDIPIVFGT